MIADIMPLICSHISDGVTYKSFIFAAKFIYDSLGEHLRQDYVDRFSDHIAMIAMMDTNAPLDIRRKYWPLDRVQWGGGTSAIYLNKFVTYEYVMAHLNVGWRLCMLRGMSQQQMESIITAMHYRISNTSADRLLEEGSISLDFYIRHLRPDGDFKNVSHAEVIPLNFISSRPLYRWNWEDISCRSDLTEDFILKHLHHLNIRKIACKYPVHTLPMFKGGEWKQDWHLRRRLSENRNLSADFIRENHADLDMSVVTKGTNLRVIADNMDIPWTTDLLARPITSGKMLSAMIKKFGMYSVAREWHHLQHIDALEDFLGEHLAELKVYPSALSMVARNRLFTKRLMSKFGLAGLLHPNEFRLTFCNDPLVTGLTDLNVDLYELNTEFIPLNIAKKLAGYVNWTYLSSSNVIGIQEIMDHPELPWSAKAVSARPDVTWRIVKKYSDFPWDFTEMYRVH